MDIVGDRKFIEIPGGQILELPPLLVNDHGPRRRLDKVVDMAAKVIENEDLVPSINLDHIATESDVERRKMDMAINLVDLYVNLGRHWNWGNGILEWIRQCEITFETRLELRALLRPDIWPHAGRSSFVKLLEDKSIHPDGVNLEQAVGLRLTYRHLPPLADFSDQFLFYLNGKLADTAYQTWAGLSPNPISSLPPERFHLQVVSM
jgi:hypothetical protein